MRLGQRRVNYVRNVVLWARQKVIYEFLKKGTSMREIERIVDEIEQLGGWNAWAIIHYYGFDKRDKKAYPNLTYAKLNQQMSEFDDEELEEFHLSEETPDDIVLDYQLNLVETDGTDVLRNMKVRRGQHKLRNVLLSSYEHRCALCSVSHRKLLVTSHIKSWADSSKEERVDPTNAIIMCKLHDALFENGFISLTDNYKVIYSRNFDFIEQGISVNLFFKPPKHQSPNSVYLNLHRKKHGLL